MNKLPNLFCTRVLKIVMLFFLVWDAGLYQMNFENTWGREKVCGGRTLWLCRKHRIRGSASQSLWQMEQVSVYSPICVSICRWTLNSAPPPKRNHLGRHLAAALHCFLAWICIQLAFHRWIKLGPKKIKYKKNNKKFKGTLNWKSLFSSSVSAMQICTLNSKFAEKGILLGFVCLD